MNSTFPSSLMMKADALRRRLAALEAAPRPSSDAIRNALRELDDVLEQLRAAAERLQIANDEVVVARQQTLVLEDRYNQLLEGLPLPVIVTDDDGRIEEANVRAADLLNVAQRYLHGKPLLLFLPDREEYFAMIGELRAVGCTFRSLTLRPREQRPRKVTMGVSVIPSSLRWCWQVSEGHVACSV